MPSSPSRTPYDGNAHPGATARETVAATTDALVAERIALGLEPDVVAMTQLAKRILAGDERVITIDRALVNYTKSGYVSKRSLRSVRTEDADLGKMPANDRNASATNRAVEISDADHRDADTPAPSNITAEPDVEPLPVTAFPLAVLGGVKRRDKRGGKLRRLGRSRPTFDPEHKIVVRLAATTTGRARRGIGEASAMLESICRAHPGLRARVLAEIPRTLRRNIERYRAEHAAEREFENYRAKMAAMAAEWAARNAPTAAGDPRSRKRTRNSSRGRDAPHEPRR